MNELSIKFVAGSEHAQKIVDRMRDGGGSAVEVAPDDAGWVREASDEKAVVVIGPGIDRQVQFGLIDRLQGSDVRLFLYAPEFEKLTEGLGEDVHGLRCVRIPTSGPWPHYLPARRAIDIVVSSGVLLLGLLPLTLILAPLIKLGSPGPVFHSADMVGENGGNFVWRKFRSMRVVEGADEARAEQVTAARGGAGAEGETTKIVDESRVTGIGRLIRKSTIDEMPQFVNILRGEMTLVGPRPCLAYEFEGFSEWEKRRTIVKAGITGVWAVHGRSIVNFDEQVAMDLCGYYRRSTLGDMRLVLQTALIVIRGKGAG